MTHHLSPTTDRRGYKSPADGRHTPTLTTDLQDNYYTTHQSKQIQARSPRPKNSIGDWEQDHPTTLKLLMMKQMVMGLLVHHSNQNRQFDDGLNQLLLHLKILLGCIPKRTHKKRQNTNNLQQFDIWNEQNAHLSLTLTRLKQISRTKEIRDTLLALEKVHNKILLKQDHLILTSPRMEASPETRRSQIFHSKKPSNYAARQSQFVLQSQLRQLKTQMVILRKQKVKLMMELNREIDISNKKSQQIKVLNGLITKKGLKPSNNIYTNCNNTPSKLGVDRCRSNPKDINILTYSSNFEYELMNKQQQITALVNQNKSLRLQIKQLKDLPFTDSFLSQAFNVKDQIVLQNKSEYQKTISDLKSQIFELQNKVDSVKYSSEEGEKRMSFQQTMQARSMKEKSDKSRLMPTKVVFQLQASLKKQQSIRNSLEKEVEFLRSQQKSLTLQINYLKSEVLRLKTSIAQPISQQYGRSSSNSKLSSTGFRFRR